MKTGGDITKKKLLMEALRLFAQKPYDKVTLREIESVTGLSRGAIMYHVPNKETLFKESVEMFVFSNNTLTSLSTYEKSTLKDTIENFISILKKEQKFWAKMGGVKNINYALFNIQYSYYSLFKGSLQIAGEWYENECSLWKEVIEEAIKNKEIRMVDADLLSHIFEDCYFGAAYSGITNPKGYSLDKVRDELLSIYNMIVLS